MNSKSSIQSMNAFLKNTIGGGGRQSWYFLKYHIHAKKDINRDTTSRKMPTSCIYKQTILPSAREHFLPLIHERWESFIFKKVNSIWGLKFCLFLLYTQMPLKIKGLWRTGILLENTLDVSVAHPLQLTAKEHFSHSANSLVFTLRRQQDILLTFVIT